MFCFLNSDTDANYQYSKTKFGSWFLSSSDKQKETSNMWKTGFVLSVFLVLHLVDGSYTLVMMHLMSPVVTDL